MKKIMMVFFMSLLFAEEGIILTIDDHEFSLFDFFSRVPKKQWERADSLQKDNMFTEFIVRELGVLEAERLGLRNDPDVAIKIRNRSRQLLVNESYEQFVARPLIAPSDIALARKYAKKELFASHILIGHYGSSLSGAPQRTVDEAFVLSQQIKNEFESGIAFELLAEKYSDDPGVRNNAGSLGWVPWGATVHAFQLAAFGLDVGEMSVPVLTSFGYHLILISDIRSSDNQYLHDEAYESLVINIAKNSIRDKLRPAALKYDSLKIEHSGVLFNMNAIQTIIEAYNRFQKENSLIGSNLVDSATLLGSLNELGVVCVYGGKGYGPKWFAQHLGHIPSSRRPSFNSGDEIVSVFRTIILQNIAINDGLSGGVHSSFTYRQRQKDMVAGFLYDAYLKHLVRSAPVPDSMAVLDYYNKKKEVDYMEPEKFIVREIRVTKRSVADSLLLLLGTGTDFSFLASQNSSINPGEGGLYGPFQKNQNRSFFDVASRLDIGEIGPVLSSPGNGFSIIQLVERVPEYPLALSLVYVQIESLLTKKNQDDSKKDGIDGLLNGSSIIKNISLLN